ncbi:MAG: metalloregulator ArsR/SmtB family transcription factor [Lachnospiraceae bacterium]|nr:metalloregulator ArsR/SmtB family transcription factor [Lachnospiraceae bacterium]
MEQKEQFEMPVCECKHVHEELVASLKEQTPDETVLIRLADLFKIFGDPTRIKILYALLEHEMCVCDIAQLLGMTQSSISHQLRILKQSSLVKFRRDGKMVFYSLADQHVMTILSQGFEHVTE